MILSDEAIEIAVDEIAKALVIRGLTPEQVGDRIRGEAQRVEDELKSGQF